MGPGDLDDLLRGLVFPGSPSLLIGPATRDDAGVFLLDDERALIQTLDFFTPIVDRPRMFGKIAAANSLSDVYAMGGRPICAMNIVCFPAGKADPRILREIIEGGNDILETAGCALAGGHTVDDDEIKYGMSVTGLVHPDRIWANSGARPGDSLILTKPVGTGVLITAAMAEMAQAEHVERTENLMATLNKTAAETASKFPINGATDITGFGLAGHLVEMAAAGRVSIEITASKVPLLPGALEYATCGLVPAGAYRNREAFAQNSFIESTIDIELSDLLFDAQTSGGLLLSLPSTAADRLVDELRKAGVAEASSIGRVIEKKDKDLYLLP